MVACASQWVMVFTALRGVACTRKMFFLGRFPIPSNNFEEVPQMDIAHRLAQQVRALGNDFNPDVNAATRDIYRSHIDMSPAGEEQRDVAYGEHERHRLDVYLPNGRPRGVVVYVHGGGFIGGDKNSDGVFYVNIGRWLARHGWTAVIPNYRLAPAATWPDGTRDIAAVMRWVRHRAPELAPLGSPVAVWGQSAGASHVASWLYDAHARGEDEPVDVSAVMLMSGLYELQAPLAGGTKLYFGDDASQYARRAPIAHAAALDVPLWLSVAELDPADIAQHTWALARTVTLAQGRSPDFHYFRGHNHVSTVQSLGSPQTDAAEEILRFLDSVGH
jgi:acetyl esterase/lipase